MSRYRTFALLAALLALAATLTACGGSSSNSDEDPQKVVENATLEGVKSGNLELSLDVNSAGKEGGNVKVSLSGPFQGAGGKETLPELDLSAKAQGEVNGEGVDFEGGLTVLSDRAFVNYKGTEYEVDPTTFGFVKSSFEQAQQGSGKEASSADVTACQEAAEGLKFEDFFEELKNEGSADVEGTTTTQVSGEVNVGSTIDALIKLSENPACSSQLEAAGPLPIKELEEAKSEVTSAVKKAHAELFVGDDDIVRKLDAELQIEPKGSKETVEIDLSLVLSGVNEEQEINAPSGAKPLEGLFRKLGVNPLELLEVAQGEGGFEGLLEGLMEGATGGSSFGGGGGGGEASGGSAASQQEYLNCLKGARTPTDLQKCARLAQ
ncbi:MAG TPA: hypothetical protein VHA54_01395 [Solirubrobacterales bacterium]|nr:hypothetical protein [Solirubrobacterales bacterium]